MNLSALCLLNIRLAKTFTFELPFKQLVDLDSDINWKQSLAIGHQNSVLEKEQDICKSLLMEDHDPPMHSSLPQIKLN
jgi:sporulation-control protein spo0M